MYNKYIHNYMSCSTMHMCSTYICSCVVVHSSSCVLLFHLFCLVLGFSCISPTQSISNIELFQVRTHEHSFRQSFILSGFHNQPKIPIDRRYFGQQSLCCLSSCWKTRKFFLNQFINRTKLHIQTLILDIIKHS